MEEPDSDLNKDEVFSLAGKFRFVPHLEHDRCLQTLSNLTLINHPNIRRYIPSKTDIDDNHFLSPSERRHRTFIYIRSIVIVSRFYFPSMIRFPWNSGNIFTSRADVRFSRGMLFSHNLSHSCTLCLYNALQKQIV